VLQPLQLPTVPEPLLSPIHHDLQPRLRQSCCGSPQETHGMGNGASALDPRRISVPIPWRLVASPLLAGFLGSYIQYALYCKISSQDVHVQIHVQRNISTLSWKPAVLRKVSSLSFFAASDLCPLVARCTFPDANTLHASPSSFPHGNLSPKNSTLATCTAVHSSMRFESSLNRSSGLDRFPSTL